MKLNATSISTLGISTLAVAVTTALGELPKPPLAAPHPQPESTTIYLAANGGDAAQEAPLTEVWQGADNAYSFANGLGDFNFWTSRQGATAHTLVIPKEGPDPKSLSEVEEDMNVMAHILNKAITPHDEKGRHAMGIIVHSGSGSQAPRNLYLEGYGAVFFLNVNYPLVAPAEKKADSDAKDETSSEWEEARREIHRPAGQPFDMNIPPVASVNGSPMEEYDADKVEDLKKDLVTALKNAAHIRSLKADETVTIVVTGRASTVKMAPRRSSSGSGSGRGVNSSTSRSVNSTSEARGTKLILRAQKSDLESFQKEKMSLDDLRKKVAVIVY
jgi:hypothetical protein